MAMSSLRKHIHKDYIKRAQANNQKKLALQKLKRKAALRNPYEFYLKRRTNMYPEDDLEYILLKKEIKEIDVELEKIYLERKDVISELEEANVELEKINLERKEVISELEEANLELEEINADIEAITSEAEELENLLYDLQKRRKMQRSRT